jgi:hypothetical protein
MTQVTRDRLCAVPYMRSEDPGFFARRTIISGNRPRNSRS